jgi:hypothetical protein
MVLRIFKGTGPGVIFLISATLLAVWISAFLNPLGDTISCYETDPMPLYGLLKLILGNNPLTGVGFSFLLVALLAILIVNFNTNIFFINERTFLPALFYILSGSLFPHYQLLNPVIPASLFLMLAIRRIMDGYHKPGIAYNFFDAGFLISTGSLFYTNLIWFGILVFIGIALIRTGNLIEISISFIGLLTPYLLTFGIYYVIGKDLPALLSLIGKNLFGKSEGFHINVLPLIALIYTAVVVLISVAYLFGRMNTKKIKTRKIFSLLIWLFILSLAIFFVLPSVSFEIVWLTSIPVSYFLAHYFVLIKKRLVPEVLFSLLLIFVLLIQIWHPE